MKFLMFTLVLSLFVSCNGKSGDKNQSKEANGLETQTPAETSRYVKPQIGIHRSFVMNYDLDSMYERLTINPTGNGSVLGNFPFWLDMKDNGGFDVHFYSGQNLKSVKYLDFGRMFNSKMIESLGISDVKNRMPTQISDYADEFTYGLTNVYAPKQDMKNKVFIIETQESDYPYLSTMTLMIWADCEGLLQVRSTSDYSCENGKLRFHYKLLDYKLEKQSR